MTKLRATLATGLALALLHAPAWAAPAPIELADFHRYAWVAEPAFSPDGERIAYSVTLDVVEDDAATSDLWVVIEDATTAESGDALLLEIIGEALQNFVELLV